MERLLHPYDKESMKMAMLKHEEMFKEQVFELHRLYRVQKILMRNMRSNQARGLDNRIDLSKANYINIERRKPLRILDLECPAEEYIIDENGDGVLQIDDENDIQLTLGPKRFPRMKKDTAALNSDAGPSRSSSSTESSFIQRSTNYHDRDDGGQELTGHDWGLIQVPNINPSFQSGKNAYEVDDNLRQDRLNRPPWLFQVLSLNMT